MNVDPAADWVNKARSLAQTGNLAGARKMLADAMRAFPDHAALANSAGDLAMKAQALEDAEQLFAKASKLDPANAEYPINQAIALQGLRRPKEAIQTLSAIEQHGQHLSKYSRVRASCARDAGDLAQSAEWYDAALKAEPAHAKALHGRARVAIERAEPDALARFDRALAVNPGDPHLWLGKAQALDVQGDVRGARQIAEQLAQQAPAWTEGLKFLAQLKLGAGEEDFTNHYAEAAARAPQDPNIWHDWIAQLAGLDFAAEAADVARRARGKFPNEPFFALLEAIHSGSAGDDERAEAIFAQLSLNDTNRQLHEARHRIRCGELAHAEQLLDLALEHDSRSISAWALLGIVWRLTGNEKGNWLHGQENLFRQLPLEADRGVLENAIPLLHQLHDNSPLPLGQSLRGGTQTRGGLFKRTEEELAQLHKGILDTLEVYRSGLPPHDATHPLLAQRKSPWHIAGSWSVRLAGGGDYHTSHIHPQGVISSALYVERTECDEPEPQAGWLEIGRPPPDLRLDLEPLAVLPPKPGHLTLFPSTLYHGTRPFSAGRRMTVAFDVVPED